MIIIGKAKKVTRRPLEDNEQTFRASQWRLMRMRFMKHKLATASLIVLVILYTFGFFAEFFSPYDPHEFHETYMYAPPQMIHLFSRGFLKPVVYSYKSEKNPETLRVMYKPDPDNFVRVRLFVRGYSYKLLGLFESNVHMFGVEEGMIFLFGTDRMGRDMFSRILHGTRISTTIGLVGVSISFFLGILIGGFAGYVGGLLDTIVQRSIELLRSIPTLPLWMALSSAIPPYFSMIAVYLLITCILSIVGWTGLARVVRSKFLSLREEDFVTAAIVAGSKRRRIIFRHMLPSFMSHIIASLTLAIPNMILGETALSFLGIGLRAPVISWGVLLQEAQNVRSIALFPWLFIPGLFVIVTVLAFNFLGDGIRDAADPYEK